MSSGGWVIGTLLFKWENVGEKTEIPLCFIGLWALCIEQTHIARTRNEQILFAIIRTTFIILFYCFICMKRENFYCCCCWYYLSWNCFKNTRARKLTYISESIKFFSLELLLFNLLNSIERCAFITVISSYGRFSAIVSLALLQIMLHNFSHEYMQSLVNVETQKERWSVCVNE